MGFIQVVRQNRVGVESDTIGLGSGEVGRVPLFRGVNDAKGEVGKDDFKNVGIEGVGVEFIARKNIKSIEVDFIHHVKHFIKDGIAIGELVHSVDLVFEEFCWNT